MADVANADPISSSIPAIHELQSVSSTPAPSDSIDEGSAQGSVKWNQGWNSFDGNWFYVDSGKPVSLHSGWLYTNGAWYWFDPSTHAMATGLHECNGSMYYFRPSGAMATGWVLDGGTWYYATGSGALARGWSYVGRAWYWLDPSTYAMVTGVQTIGSCEYIFNNSGKMMTNCWSNGDGSWIYHSSSSGAIDLKGVMTDSGIQLIDDDGNDRTGWIESHVFLIAFIFRKSRDKSFGFHDDCFAS